MFLQARRGISLAPLLAEKPQSLLRGPFLAPRLHFPGDPAARFRGSAAARPLKVHERAAPVRAVLPRAVTAV